MSALFLYHNVNCAHQGCNALVVFDVCQISDRYSAGDAVGDESALFIRSR